MNKKKSRLLRLNRFTISKLNVKNEVKGGAPFTDEDKASLRFTCILCFNEDDNIQ